MRNEMILFGKPAEGKSYCHLSKVKSVASRVHDVFMTHNAQWDGSLHDAQRIVTWFNTLYKDEENPAQYDNGYIVLNIEGKTQYLSPDQNIEIHTTLERHRLDTRTAE